MHRGSPSWRENSGQIKARDPEPARVWDDALRRSLALQMPSQSRWEWVGDSIAPFEPGTDALPDLGHRPELDEGNRVARRAASLWPAMLVGLALVGAVSLWVSLGGQRKAPRG
jgi:hypothetical protein